MPLAESVKVVCQRIAERLEKTSTASDASDQLVDGFRRKLRGLAYEFPSKDGDGRTTYRWPANGLTYDDMIRLRILSNLTGLPCNELVHLAVGVLFGQTKAIINHVVSVHEQTDISVTELLDGWHNGKPIDGGMSPAQAESLGCNAPDSMAAETGAEPLSQPRSMGNVVDAAEIKGNEGAKRQVTVAAASGVPVRFIGPQELVSAFESLAGELGVEARTDEMYRDFVVRLLEPTQRELDSSLSGVSTDEMRKQLAAMRPHVPVSFRDGAMEVLGATVRTNHLDARLEALILSVSAVIARLEGEEKIHAAHVAEAVNYVLAGDPVPKQPELPADLPPLVRPDRQLTYDGRPHWEWAEPPHDPDTITVDRLQADIDGPPHRFLVRRGDTVEVFFSKSRVELGEVVDVSHRSKCVQVRLRDRQDGIWISLGSIYPAPLRNGVELNLRRTPSRTSGPLERTERPR